MNPIDTSSAWKEFGKMLDEQISEYEDAPLTESGTGWEGIIGGFCPVQGYGEVDGLHWYFRARHDDWTFEVWDEPCHPELPQKPPVWECFGQYSNASWMYYSDAWLTIQYAILKGRAESWGNCR